MMTRGSIQVAMRDQWVQSTGNRRSIACTIRCCPSGEQSMVYGRCRLMTGPRISAEQIEAASKQDGHEQ